MTDLKTRARAANGTSTGTDVERQPTGPTLSQQIKTMEHQFALAAPRGMEAAQLVRDALTCLRQTPKLAECEPTSVLGALMTCAQLGLRPGVLGHAWVLPYWDGKARRLNAQLVIGYQGLVDLAHRSGKIASLVARAVHANDHFDIAYGLADTLVHRPAMTGPRGDVTGYYAVVKLTTGGAAFWYMTRDEMVEWRDRYAPKNRDGAVVGPWKSDFDAMGMKTCVRQLAKWMPKSTELAVALAADESVRVDVTPTMDAAETSFHVSGDEVTGEIIEDAPTPAADAAHGEDVDPTLDPAWGAK
jgi:recombination protein RecT